MEAPEAEEHEVFFFFFFLSQPLLSLNEREAKSGHSLFLSPPCFYNFLVLLSFRREPLQKKSRLPLILCSF